MEEDWHKNYDIMSKLYSYDPETGKIYAKERYACDFTDTGEGKTFVSAQGHAEIYNKTYAGKEVFRRRVRSARSTCDYLVGGCSYRGVSKNLNAHRVAFLLYHKYLPNPPNSVDHINRDGTDNRISNLREATPKMQSQNTGAYKTNKSGYRGVSYDKARKGWRAQITMNGKKHNLGVYAEMSDAISARQKAQKEYYGGKA